MTTPLGTAAWTDPEVVARNLRYKPGMFWLGRSTTEDTRPLGYKDDRHVCLVSGNRGGKGTTTIINNLALWPGSVVVIDPKGENATVTANRRGRGSAYAEGLDQKVQVLDPYGAAQVPEELRGTFNPLDALDPNHPEVVADAGLIADALVIVNDSASDPFWDRSARALVKALILFVLTSPLYEGKRNLVTVRQLLMRGEADLFQANQAIGGPYRSPHQLLWEDVGLTDTYGEILADAGASFASMLANTPKVYESVIQVARDNTEFIDSQNMRTSLATSSLALSELKTQANGLSLYLCLPQRFMNTHNRWLRTIITLATNEMERTSGQPRSGHRVLFVLDEFAGLKRMEAIEHAVAQIAGYGVKLFFVLQSLEQLKKTYNDGWETFLANAGLKIFADIEDNFSREYISKLLGDTELIREMGTKSDATTEGRSETTGSTFQTSKSRSSSVGMGPTSSNTSTSTGSGTSNSTAHNYGRSSTSGSSETLHRRPLAHPDEIGRNYARNEASFRLAGKALVLISGMQPFEINRSRYFQDELFIDTFDPHPDHPFPQTLISSVWLYEPREMVRYLSADYAESLKLGWAIMPGDSVALGELIAEVQNELVGEHTWLMSPYAGRVHSREGVTRGINPDQLFTIKHYTHPSVRDESRLCADLQKKCDEKLKGPLRAQRGAVENISIIAMLATIALMLYFLADLPRVVGAICLVISCISGYSAYSYFRAKRHITRHASGLVAARHAAARA